MGLLRNGLSEPFSNQTHAQADPLLQCCTQHINILPLLQWDFSQLLKKISQESNAKKVKAKHNNSKKEFTLELHRVLHLVMIIFTFVSGFRLFLFGLFFSPSSDTKLSCGLLTLRCTRQWTESKTPLIREWAIPQSVLTEMLL